MSVLEDPSLVPISDIERIRVEWHWKDWLPVGKLVILDGDPGVGKTTICCDLAAHLTKGVTPSGDPCSPVSVIFLSSEDSPGDTLRPRLEAAGGDLSKVRVLNPNSSLPSFPSKTSWLEEEIADSDVGLVVVDPLTGFLGSTVDSHRDQDVRNVLNPLGGLAEKHSVTIIGVRHLRKSSGSAIQRGSGSIGFTAAARMVWLAGRDHNTKGLVLAQVKNNLSKHPRSLCYEIAEHDDTSKIRWGEESSITADALCADNNTVHSALSDAEDFLKEFLTNGPVSSKELEAAAEAEGISIRTLTRAKTNLNVKSSKIGSSWFCELPNEVSQLSHIPELANLAQLS